MLIRPLPPRTTGNSEHGVPRYVFDSSAGRPCMARRMDPSKGCQVANDAILKIFHVFFIYIMLLMFESWFIARADGFEDWVRRAAQLL